MLGLPKIHFIILLLIFHGNQAESDASNHRYRNGDIVPFYVNKVGPFHSPQVTYAYYDLPFCSPDTVFEQKLSLGEMLNGDRLISAPYEIKFLEDKDFEILCNKTLSKTDVSQFRNVIEKDYYMQLYYDDLPLWSFIGFSRRDYTDERTGNIYFLYKHFDFEVYYNKNHVIEVNVRTSPNFLANVTEDKEVVVDFTYSVKWSVTQQSFDKRMEKYTGFAFLPHHMSIHYATITNSSITLLILIICVLTFYVLVLRKDISKYTSDVEENQGTGNQEETGWKNIHGDVFRFPKHESLFAAALGSGSQLLVLIVAILALGLLGFFPPYVRGELWNAIVIVYAITNVVSGYTSVSFYSQLEGTTCINNLLVTGGLYFGPLFLTFCFLNSVAISYGATVALPLGAIVILSLIVVFLASPLLLLGAVVGKHTTPDFQAPCKTTKCPREVPRQRWYRSLVPQMVLAGILPFSVIYVQLYYIYATVWGHRIYTLYGILSVVFVILLIITALISVVMTYFQLAVEDHEWWWRYVTMLIGWQGYAFDHIWYSILEFLGQILTSLMDPLIFWFVFFTLMFFTHIAVLPYWSFFCGGSTGLFIYGYCIYYYIFRSDMNGFMQISFFFGYMACVCYGIFLVLGTVGFRASLLFVRYLYAAIKCD